MVTDFIIERLNHHEWAEYKDIRLEALSESSLAFGMSYEDESSRSDLYWQQMAKRYAMGFFDWMCVAKINAQMVGTTGFFLNPYRKKRHVATIVNVYVKKDFRGQGIARQLFEYTMDAIRQDKKILKVKLTVNPLQETALKMYLSYGFEIVGKMQKELRMEDSFCDEWILEKWIGPYEDEKSLLFC